MFEANAPLAVLRRLTNPVVVVLSLILAVKYQGEPLDGYYLALAIIAFYIAGQLFEDFFIMRATGRHPLVNGFVSILIAWGLSVGALLFLAFVTRLHILFDRNTILQWFAQTPIFIFLAQIAIRRYIKRAAHSEQVRRAVIIGANEVGVRLARRMDEDESLLTQFVGYFDDRAPERLAESTRAQLLGHVRDIHAYINEHGVDVIYIALPISQKDRITRLLEHLKDTTASVYLVPDIFTYDLIQARIDLVGGMPVIAVLETPFLSINAFNKRVSDIALSLLILALIAPLMLGIALAVKLTSRGPVIFRQRRYGLKGEEIIVYKFRSMTVCEDGDHVTQARKGDCRFTPIGAFLRKTSLDELPQFINVLQGRMSIVGPRPHAVAHNELYRKLIPGYMLRHKVKPGITGWAQVNGYRGETETVEKMAARVEYDLNYMRNWRLSLDLMIIAKTVWLVFKDSKAH
jgi:putative colanic acid biosynthesis UDP-glucose lipid carrier transferase